MSVRKRNEFLDADLSSDDESPGYDSEQAAGAESRTVGVGSQRPKRRKLSTTLSQKEKEDEEDDDIEASEEDHPTNPQSHSLNPPAKAPPNAPHNQLASTPPPAYPPATTTTTNSTNRIPPHTTLSKPTSKTKPKNPSKPGILYLSRPPPYLSPHKIRHLLSPFGPITQIYLTPEPPSARASRLAKGGNKKRSYIDGWIEFSRRRDAKSCAEAINGQTVGGKKGGWYRDDVWSVRYLKGFGWGDLMEGVRREEREREERVRVGVERGRREREGFLRGVERGKAGEREIREKGGKAGEREIREKGEKGWRSDAGREGGGSAGGGLEQKDEKAVGVKGKREQMRFKQSDVVGKEKKGVEQPDEVKRVLRKIF